MSEADPQNVAFCFRTPQKLLVVHADLVGEVHIQPYNELLNKPFVKSVQARSLQSHPPDLVESTASFVEKLQQDKVRNSESGSDFYKRLLKERFERFFLTNRIAADCVPHYLRAARILNCDPRDPKVQIDFLKALNSSTPSCVYPGYSYSQPVMIRSLITADVKR